MGLYYNPNPPNIGTWQPLEPRKLTPPSGPVPQNPPLTGAKVPAAVLISWIPPAPAAVVAVNLIPRPVSPYVPPSVYRDYGWYTPYLLPTVAGNLDPPISGPTPQNPPIKGSRVPVEVLIGWIPPPPAPIVAINLDPPIAGPTISNPPIIGSIVPSSVLISWLPPTPMPIVAINLDPPVQGPTPQNPPFQGGALVPNTVLINWLPPVPMPIVGPKYTLGIVAPSNPPFPGSRVPVEVQIAWLPPAPMPIRGAILTPPSGPIYLPIGSRVPVEVQVNWLPPVPMPILAVNLNPPQSAPPYSPIGSTIPTAVLISWIPLPPAPPIGFAYLTPSGPVAQNPQFLGTRVSTEVLSSWNPLPTNPVQPPIVFYTPSGLPPPPVINTAGYLPFLVSVGQLSYR